MLQLHVYVRLGWNNKSVLLHHDVIVPAGSEIELVTCDYQPKAKFALGNSAYACNNSH